LKPLICVPAAAGVSTELEQAVILVVVGVNSKDLEAGKPLIVSSIKYSPNAQDLSN
jgi:hypothetical protein